MKLKNGFVLKEIADSFLVVPLGSRIVDFSGIIKLNETGAFLWSLLENECEKDVLVTALLDEYNVDLDKASADVDAFVSKLKDADLLE